MLEGSGPSLFDVIGRIYARRESGVLIVQRADSSRRLYFRSGELYLAPTHPLAIAIAERLAEGETDGASDRAVRGLVQRMADALRGWSGDEISFHEKEDEIPPDAVGPLPTSALLAAGSVAGADVSELIRLLGGEDAVWRSIEGSWTGQRNVHLDPTQAYLLSRLDRPTALRTLLSHPSLGPEQMLRNLRQLQVLGLIVPASSPDAIEAEGLLPDGLFERFLERVERSLDDRAVDLGHETHKMEAENLLAEEPANYFELLHVDPHASAEDVYRTYFHLARRLHPRHAAALRMGERKNELRDRLRRLTEAYLTLSDPDRRTAYTAAVLPPASVSKEQRVDTEGETEQRRKQRQVLAQQQFQEAVAQAKLLDYHYAVQLLTQAVAVDPRPEYLVLLAECQAHNPKWLDRAAENYSKALELDPNDADVWVSRARVMEKIGRFEEARRNYGRALQLQPAHIGAQLGLDNLRQQARSRGGGGVLGALRRLFGG